jgi:eukaryotic-like serine/threonine-protein kinase
VVQNAVEAASSISRLDACEQDRALGHLELPLDDDLRGRIEALQGVLAQARARTAAGRYASAQHTLGEARAELDAVHFPPLHAEALLTEATILERVGDYAGAERHLLETIWTATAVGDDATSARAWVQLVWVSGVERIEPEQGHLWSRFARTTIERIGGDAVLDATLAHNLGGVLYRQGRHDEALRSYEGALEVQIELLGPDDPAVAMTLNHIGNVLMEKGEYVAAREFCERSLDVRRRRLGGRHPKVAASLNNLAELFRKQRDSVRSLEYARRSLEIVAETGGPEEEIALVLASDALGRLARWEERLPNDRRLLALRQASRAPTGQSIADAQRRLAEALAALGRSTDAAESEDPPRRR